MGLGYCPYCRPEIGEFKGHKKGCPFYKTKIYENGYHARLMSSIKRDENPYKKEEERNEWFKGYDEAEKEYIEYTKKE